MRHRNPRGGDKNKEVRGGISKAVGTICHILRLKCTKFDLGWVSAPDLAFGGAHSAPNTSQLDLRGLRLRKGKGRNGREGKRREGEEGDGEDCVMAFGGWTPLTLNLTLVR